MIENPFDKLKKPGEPSASGGLVANPFGKLKKRKKGWQINLKPAEVIEKAQGAVEMLPLGVLGAVAGAIKPDLKVTSRAMNAIDYAFQEALNFSTPEQRAKSFAENLGKAAMEETEKHPEGAKPAVVGAKAVLESTGLPKIVRGAAKGWQLKPLPSTQIIEEKAAKPLEAWVEKGEKGKGWKVAGAGTALSALQVLDMAVRPSMWIEAKGFGALQQEVVPLMRTINTKLYKEGFEGGIKGAIKEGIELQRKAAQAEFGGSPLTPAESARFRLLHSDEFLPEAQKGYRSVISFLRKTKKEIKITQERPMTEVDQTVSRIKNLVERRFPRETIKAAPEAEIYTEKMVAENLSKLAKGRPLNEADPFVKNLLDLVRADKSGQSAFRQFGKALKDYEGAVASGKPVKMATYLPEWVVGRMTSAEAALATKKPELKILEKRGWEKPKPPPVAEPGVKPTEAEAKKPAMPGTPDYFTPGMKAAAKKGWQKGQATKLLESTEGKTAKAVAQAEEDTFIKANLNPVTGGKNAALFSRDFPRVLREAKQRGMYVVDADLDLLKHYQDPHGGKLTGDAMLQKAHEVLSKTKGIVNVYHLHGDEFAVVVKPFALEKLPRAFRDVTVKAVDGATIPVSMTFGAVKGSDIANLDDYFVKGEAALKSIKNARKGELRVWEEGLGGIESEAPKVAAPVVAGAEVKAAPVITKEAVYSEVKRLDDEALAKGPLQARMVGLDHLTDHFGLSSWREDQDPNAKALWEAIYALKKEGKLDLYGNDVEIPVAQRGVQKPEVKPAAPEGEAGVLTTEEPVAIKRKRQAQARHLISKLRPGLQHAIQQYAKVKSDNWHLKRPDLVVKKDMIPVFDGRKIGMQVLPQIAGEFADLKFNYGDKVSSTGGVNFYDWAASKSDEWELTRPIKEPDDLLRVLKEGRTWIKEPDNLRAAYNEYKEWTEAHPGKTWVPQEKPLGEPVMAPEAELPTIQPDLPEQGQPIIGGYLVTVAEIPEDLTAYDVIRENFFTEDLSHLNAEELSQVSGSQVRFVPNEATIKEGVETKPYIFPEGSRVIHASSDGVAVLEPYPDTWSGRMRKKGIHYDVQTDIFQAMAHPIEHAEKLFLAQLNEQQQLVMAYQRKGYGAEQAINKLIEAKLPYIYGQIGKLPDTAKWDGFSYAMEYVWNCATQYDLKKGPWENYVNRAIHNAVERARIEWKYSHPEHSPLEELTEQVGDYRKINDTLDAYRDLISAIRPLLSKTQDRVLRMYLEGYTYKLIQKEVSISGPAMSKILFQQIPRIARNFVESEKQVRMASLLKKKGAAYDVEAGVDATGNWPVAETPGAPKPYPVYAEGVKVVLPEKVTGANDIVDIVKQFRDLQKEHVFAVGYLDDGTVLTVDPIVFVGSFKQSIFNPPEIIRGAYTSPKRGGKPMNLVVGHTHGTGVAELSDEDIKSLDVFKGYLEGMKEIKYQGHIIVSQEGYNWFTPDPNEYLLGLKEWGPGKVEKKRYFGTLDDVIDYLKENYLPGHKKDRYLVVLMDGANRPVGIRNYDNIPTLPELKRLQIEAAPDGIVVAHEVNRTLAEAEMEGEKDKNFEQYGNIRNHFLTYTDHKFIFDKLLYGNDFAASMERRRKGRGGGELLPFGERAHKPWTVGASENPIDLELAEAERLSLLPQDEVLDRTADRMYRIVTKTTPLKSQKLPFDQEVNILNLWMTPRTVVNPVWEIMTDAEERRVNKVEELAKVWSPLLNSFRTNSPVDQTLAFISDGKTVPPEILGKLSEKDKELVDKVLPLWRETHMWIAQMEGLPEEFRKTEYLPHIFEKMYHLGVENERTGPEGFAMRNEEVDLPNEIYEPFLKERKNAPGYLMSFKRTFGIRIKYGLRKIYYEPAIKACKPIIAQYPPNKQRYAVGWVYRILGKPSWTDQHLKPLAQDLNTALRPIFHREVVNPSAPAMAISRAIVRFYLNCYLGLALDSTIKNLGQNAFTAGRVGLLPYLRGVKALATEEGRMDLADSGVLKEFTQIMEREVGVTTTILDKAEDINMAPFQFAEFINKGVAYLTAHRLAMRTLGKYYDLDDPALNNIAEHISREVARDFTFETQFEYGVYGTPPIFQGPLGKIAVQFLSFPMKTLESWINYADLWGMYNRSVSRAAHRNLYLEAPGLFVKNAKGVPVKRTPGGGEIQEKPGPAVDEEGTRQLKFFFRFLGICGAAYTIGKILDIDVSEVFGTKIFPTFSQLAQGASPGIQNLTLILQYMGAKPEQRPAILQKFMKRHTWRYPSKVVRIVKRQAQGGEETTKKATLKYGLAGDIYWLLGYRSTTPPETLETFGPEGP